MFSVVSKVLAFWRSVPHRFRGIHLGAGEQFTSLSTRATFEADQALERRIRAAREALGPVEPKGDRKLLEDHADTFRKAVDVPEDSFPIG